MSGFQRRHCHRLTTLHGSQFLLHSNTSALQIPYDPHHNKFSPEPKAIDQSKLKIYNPSYPAIRIKWVMKGKMVEHYH